MEAYRANQPFIPQTDTQQTYKPPTTGTTPEGSVHPSGTVPPATTDTANKINAIKGDPLNMVSQATTNRIMKATAETKHETARKIKYAFKNFFMKLASSGNERKTLKPTESMMRHLDPKHVLENLSKNTLMLEKSPKNVMLYIQQLIQTSHNSSLQPECVEILQKLMETHRDNQQIVDEANALFDDVCNWNPNPLTSPGVSPTNPPDPPGAATFTPTNPNPSGAATFTPTNPQPTGAARTAPNAPNIDELLASATNDNGPKKFETLRVLVHLLTPPPQPQTNYSEQAKEALKTLAKDPNQRGPIALTMQVVYNALSPAQNKSREQLLNAFGEILSEYGYQAKLDPINGTDPFSYTQRT